MLRRHFHSGAFMLPGFVISLVVAITAPALAGSLVRFVPDVSHEAAPYYSRLFAFADDAGGAAPRGAPVADAAGNLYGVAGGDAVLCSQARTGACGLIFKLTPFGNHYTESVLYDFSAAIANGQPESVVPSGTLTVGPLGVLYGSTFLGGAHGYGSVYSLVPTAAGYVERDLYDFTGTGDGAGPNGALVAEATGALYGTTQTTAYKLTPGPQGYVETTLHTFGIGLRDGAEFS